MESILQVKPDQQFGRENQASNYMMYRPTYPKPFLDSAIVPLANELKSTKKELRAIDLACGSGQLTIPLLNYFNKVIGAHFSDEQLESGTKRDQNLIQSGKLQYLKFDCAKIDDLLKSDEIQKQDIDCVFMAQAFHWFDYHDFLTRFTKESNHPYLFIMGYVLFELSGESKKYHSEFKAFLDDVLPLFICDRESLDNQHRNLDFHKYFKNVEFTSQEQLTEGYPIQNFVGYLDSMSGYRNYLEQHKDNPKDDPLLRLMEKLGLKNHQSKEFSKIEFSDEAPRTISFTNKFFVYKLK